MPYDPAINRPDSPTWPEDARIFLKGVRGELCASAPKQAGREIESLLLLVDAAKSQGSRRKLLRRIETVLGSKPYFRGATRRYLECEFVGLVLKETVAGLKTCLELAKQIKALQSRSPQR